MRIGGWLTKKRGNDQTFNYIEIDVCSLFQANKKFNSTWHELDGKFGRCMEKM